METVPGRRHSCGRQLLSPASRFQEALTWGSRIVSAMASNTSFGRDTGLQARMLLTMLLLGLVYAVLVGVLIASGIGTVLIVIIAGGLLLLQLFVSDKLALASMGARTVSPAEAPELHAMIERLCVQADLPKPKIASRQHAHAQRLRASGAPPSQRHGLRHHGDHGDALPRRARGRHGPRAHPRRATATSW